MVFKTSIGKIHIAILEHLLVNSHGNPASVYCYGLNGNPGNGYCQISLGKVRWSSDDLWARILSKFDISARLKLME